jgi:hypothetical protein
MTGCALPSPVDMRSATAGSKVIGVDAVFDFFLEGQWFFPVNL